MGPLPTGTRIVFRNQTHQDVKELFDEVVSRINAVRSHMAAAFAGSIAKQANG